MVFNLSQRPPSDDRLGLGLAFSMEYPIDMFTIPGNTIPFTIATGPGLLDGIDNSVRVPPSWRTGPGGSTSISTGTGTHSGASELAGERVSTGPSIPSHWHASGPGRFGMPVNPMPPGEIAPLPALHQLELDQQFLHAPMPQVSVPQVSVPHVSMPHWHVQQELRREIEQLKIDNLLLDSRYTTLFFAYNALLRRIPNAVGFNVGPLERADYPHVKFWCLADWTKYYREADPQPTGAMQYVEDRQGLPVTGEMVNMMRSLAQNIWVELGISGAASTTWGQVDIQSKKGYYRAMAASFFELRLCAADWKADKIAEVNYDLWILRWRAQTQAPSLGPGPEATASGSSQSKRVRKPSMVARGQSKKSKVKSTKESSGSLADQERDNVM